MTPFVAKRRFNWAKELSAKGWYHSVELGDGTVTDGLITLDRLKSRVAQMPIPEDLSGKRVLYIGAWDGWFSFEMERRGASVVAVDCVEIENFLCAHEARKSKVEYRILDVMELNPRELGTFDIVLFLGVLYHLKHPLLALEKVCELTRDLAIVESHINADPDAVEGYPRMEFYEHDELGEQLDNWWGPSVECLVAMCRTAGFARAELRDVSDDRGTVACYRKWPAFEPAAAAPTLNGVQHNRNYGFNFYTARDEYVSCWFTPPPASPEPARDTVYPEVSGFGVRPIDVRKFDEHQWLATFKLPPGLAPGWHEVRLRTEGSAFTAPARIAVDIEPAADRLKIESLCDGRTWARNEVSSGFVSAWVTGLPETADLGNVRILIDGHAQVTLFIAQPDENGARQVNARLRAFVRPGAHIVTVQFGATRSQQVDCAVR